MIALALNAAPASFSLAIAMATSLPVIPAKRYFTIGEVAELCEVKPHVLRYWEQEFTQLRPMKRRGNRRYYQHHEVLMIRRIRELLYEQGFTINGARNRLRDGGQSGAQLRASTMEEGEAMEASAALGSDGVLSALDLSQSPVSLGAEAVRNELLQIRAMLSI